MAEIAPFRGLRYHTPNGDLSAVIAPPYDVISPAQQDALYSRSDHNVVRLEYSREPAPERYQRVAADLAAWRAAGVLRAEELPALYRYVQSFEHGGTAYQRTAVFARVALEPIERRVILPHEYTMARPKEDRLALLAATRTNISPVYSLMRDPAGALARAIREAPAAASASGTDVTGQGHRVEVITDVDAVAPIVSAVRGQQLYIADGHHRYETALAYQAARPDDPGAAATLMALSPADDPGLLILPIHRLVTPRAPVADLAAALTATFRLEDAGAADDAQAVTAIGARLHADDAGATLAAVGLTPGRLTLLHLTDRAAVERRMPAERSAAWKALAVNILQFGVLEPLLGIDAPTLEAGEHVRFSEDATEAAHEVLAGTVPLAFLLPATRVDEMMAVADTGDRMPQKSTYFYPKLGTGLVLNAHDV